MTGSPRLALGVVSSALAALLLQPLVAAPTYAGVACELPVPLPGDDCTAPDTELTGTPDDPTESRAATFTFRAPEPGASFECSFDGAEWSACGDPQSSDAETTGWISYSALTYGGHAFAVRAVDAAMGAPNRDDSPATFDWTVVEPDGPPPPDTEDPRTVITSTSERWHPFSFLGITYRASEDASGFECTLNGRPRACDDDQVTLLGMAPGDYLFTVAARDAAGNLDPSPATDRWTVPVNNTALDHSRGWEKRTAGGHFQDSYSVTDVRGAFLEQAKQGFRSVALVATRCPGCGKVAVSLGGRLLDTVDLGAPRTRKRQVLPVASWRRPQSGRVRVEVQSQGKAVLVEGLGFSGRR